MDDAAAHAFGVDELDLDAVARDWVGGKQQPVVLPLEIGPAFQPPDPVDDFGVETSLQGVAGPIAGQIPEGLGHPAI